MISKNNEMQLEANFIQAYTIFLVTKNMTIKCWHPEVPLSYLEDNLYLPLITVLTKNE
jgi:hypothetical protein